MADVELDVGLNDELTGPATAEMRALRALAQEIENVQRHAASASSAERQLAGAMRSTSSARPKWSEDNERKTMGDLFMAEQLSSAMQSITGGGMLASIGTTIGTLIGGPIGSAIGGAIGGALGGIIGAIQNAISSVYGLGKAFFWTVTGAAMLRDQSVRAFTAMWGSGEQVLKDTRDLAVELGMPLESAIDMTRMLGSFGFNKGQSEQLMRQFADLKAIGKSDEDIKGIALAIAQVRGKGRLQMEELTAQLSERGLGPGAVIPHLQKLLGGKSADEVRKMITAGKVDSDTGIKAIQAAMQDMVGGGPAGSLALNAKGIGAEWTRLQTTISAGVMDIAAKAAPSYERLAAVIRQASGYLTSAAGASWIDAAADGIDMIVTGLETGAKMVVAFAEGFGAIDASGTRSLADSLRAIGQDQTWVDSARQFGAAMAGIVAWSSMAVGAVSTLTGWINQLASAIDRLVPIAGALQAITGGTVMGSGLAPGASPAAPGAPEGAGETGLLGGLMGGLAAVMPTPSAMRAPQPADFISGPPTGWAAPNATTTNNQNNSISISVQGGGGGDDEKARLAGIIAAEVKRQIATMGAQLGV